MTLATVDSSIVAKVQNQVARVADKAVQATATYSEVISEHKKGFAELAEQVVELQKALVEKQKECDQKDVTHANVVKTLKDNYAVQIKLFKDELILLRADVAKIHSLLKNDPHVQEIQAMYGILAENRRSGFADNDCACYYPEGLIQTLYRIELFKAKIDPEHRRDNFNGVYLAGEANVKVLTVFDKIDLLTKIADKV